MTTEITFRQLRESLTQNGLSFGVITLQNGVQLIVTERGGRIFGPFLTPDSPSLSWINPTLGSVESLAAFLQGGEWNAAGKPSAVALGILPAPMLLSCGCMWAALNI